MAHSTALSSLDVYLKARNASALPGCPQRAVGFATVIGITELLGLSLQAYHSGPGPGVVSPSRAFALALLTLLCMQLQHVTADAGESPPIRVLESYFSSEV